MLLKAKKTLWSFRPHRQTDTKSLSTTSKSSLNVALGLSRVSNWPSSNDDIQRLWLPDSSVSNGTQSFDFLFDSFFDGLFSPSSSSSIILVSLYGNGDIDVFFQESRSVDDGSFFPSVFSYFSRRCRAKRIDAALGGNDFFLSFVRKARLGRLW